MQKQHSREQNTIQDPPSPGRKRLRQRHTELTRRAIHDAARALFAQRGYARTSMRTLAEQAGVAVPTLYSAFRSKRDILLSLVEVIDEEAGTDEIVERIRNAQEPGEAIALTATLQRRARERAGDIIRVLREGAVSDPEVSESFETGWARHRHGIEQMCRRLASDEVLRPDLDTERATATALAITSLEAWEEAVYRRSWSYDDYEFWLRESLTDALLGGAKA